MRLPKPNTFLGVDECPIYNSRTRVVVVAMTNDPSLSESLEYGELRKAADYMDAREPLPTVGELYERGLETFAWSTVTSHGRHSIHEVQTGMIAVLANTLDLDLMRSRILIDDYSSNGNRCTSMLVSCFHSKNLPVHEQQVNYSSGADRSYGIVNHADLLAAKISRWITSRNNDVEDTLERDDYMYATHRTVKRVDEDHICMVQDASHDWRVGGDLKRIERLEIWKMHKEQLEEKINSAS